MMSKLLNTLCQRPVQAMLLALLIVQTIHSPAALAQQEKVYDLKVQHKTVNFSGHVVDHAIAINGSIPAPTLRFKFGDIAVIHVTNELHEIGYISKIETARYQYPQSVFSCG